MRRAIGLLAAVGWMALAGAAVADPPPASAFGRLPAVQQAALSPTGDRVAILGGDAAARRISIAPVDGQTAVFLPLNDVQVRDLRWVGGDYLVARVAEFLPISDGVAYTIERDITLNAQARPIARLLNNGGVSAFATYLPILATSSTPTPTAYVMGLDYRDPEGMGANSRLTTGAGSLVTSVWRVDVASGHGQITERGNPNTVSMIVDRTGESRARIDFNPGNGITTLLARPKGGNWREITSGRTEDLDLLGYSDAADALWFRRTAADGHTQIVRRSLAGNAETVVSTGSLQDADLLWDNDTLEPVAIIAGGGEAPAYQWLDAALGRIQTGLQRAFPGRIVSMESWNPARTRVVVEVESRNAAPTWYLYDTQRREASALGEAYPELSGQALGTTRWTTYRARDGQQIGAYVTLPPGAAATGGRLPLVVLPHGGPASRDGPGFDWWAQYLATRGYVVLQPQFRGSSGFGEAFERAGEAEWAGKIQTDLLDGIASLAADNTIDPARVCIVGASFGGYSALAGVAFHPEAYRCAVSVAGVSDLPNMLGTTQYLDGDRSLSLRRWRRLMGASDRAALEAASPARRAAGIRAPVLLIHGEHDTTVPIDQSRAMQTAMGGRAQLVVLPGDDHYLSTSATRTRMLEAVGAFLATNLPVTAPATPAQP